MSTAAYSNNQSTKSFRRQNIRTSSTSTRATTVDTSTDTTVSAMTNDRTRHPLRKTNTASSTPLIDESVSVNMKSSKVNAPSNSIPSSSSSSVSSNQSQISENSSMKIPKQPYTYCNPPRVLQRQSIQNMKYLRHNRLRQRVSSAPDENSFHNSPRLILNQNKPSSANESSTPRSHDETPIPPASIVSHLHKRDEKQKQSFDNLMKEQERSKVPKAVQKRRIILLFRRFPGSTSPSISPRQQQNISPVRADVPLIDINQISHSSQNKAYEEIQYPSNHSTSPSSDSSRVDPFHCVDQAELADSRQIAAILANIQSSDDWIPVTADGRSPRREQKLFDPTKYEYVAKNSLDTATFRLSPRTLKPDEELAARSRFFQYSRYEMLSSANAQIPQLMASIVAENSNSVGLTTNNDKTFTFRLNSTSTMKKQNSLDEIESIPSALDGEEVQLCFDEILKCFYDPNTGTYYELTSA